MQRTLLEESLVTSTVSQMSTRLSTIAADRPRIATTAQTPRFYYVYEATGNDLVTENRRADEYSVDYGDNRLSLFSTPLGVPTIHLLVAEFRPESSSALEPRT